MERKIAVDMKKISKVYPNGVVANMDIDFRAYEGQIHALMGENGAGKSTLVKILFGIEQPSKGEIFINGNKVSIESSMKAIDLGIGMVHQHFMLVPSLTVTENIILGMEPKKRGLIDYNKAKNMVIETAQKYNFQIDPDARIKDLEVGKKQKVEILKALIRGAKILILDEPTAVLTPQETEELFEQLLMLKELGHTIIFISHKLNEIKSICEEITIMRSGKGVGVFNVADVSIDDISRLMVGRDIVTTIDKTPAKKQDVVMAVKNLSVIDEEGKAVVKDVSMNISGGVILGIAGVEGNGQGEFVDCLTGMRKPDSGSITLLGKEITTENIKNIRNMGLAHIPSDRMTYGVAAGENISDNLISDRFDKKDFNNLFVMNSAKIANLSIELIKKFLIKADSAEVPVKMLSGGNIQKVVAAREMTSNPEILVADQPTRGIDVGAAKFIHDKIVEMRDEGKAVLLISADINEVMELSDSLAVFYDGEISGYFEDTKSLTEEELGLYMLGLKKMDKAELFSQKG